MNRHRRSSASAERGASLVEFALLAPLLLLLLFGMIEFGWGVAQQIDLRHKGREALRLAVVDGTEADIIGRVCADDIVRAADITTFTRGGGSAIGDNVTVTLSSNVQEITGFFSWVWGPTPSITSFVEGRVEQLPTNWTSGESLSCP